MYRRFHCEDCLHHLLDLDPQLDVQGWSHWHRMVPRVVAIHTAFCDFGTRYDVPKEEQQEQEINIRQ